MNDSRPPGSNNRSRHKRWLTLAQVVVSAALLAWVVSKVGLGDVLRTLEGINGRWLVLAGLAFLLSVAIRAVRWQIFLKPLGLHASVGELFRLYLLGFFWNTFLPTGFGGDVVKMIALQRRVGHGAEATLSVIAERVVGLLGSSLVALSVLLMWPRLVALDISIAVLVVCVMVIVGGWVARLDFLHWLGEKAPWLHPVVGNRHLVAFHQALRTYDLKTLGLGILVAIPFTLVLIVSNYLVGLALGVAIPLRYFAIFTPVVGVASLLPISLNGLGVREYMYQLLFVPVGVADEQAITLAFVFNLLRIATGVLGGLVSVAVGARHLVQSPRPADPSASTPER